MKRLGISALLGTLFIGFCLMTRGFAPSEYRSCYPGVRDNEIRLAQFIRRIAREEQLPGRRDVRRFRRITRLEDSAFRQAARRDKQESRRTTWDYERKFRSDRRSAVRHKINQTREREQVIRKHKANFNLAQTKQRQTVRANTTRQRREQTLRISREIRQKNMARQRAVRQRREEVRDVIRGELEDIRKDTRQTEAAPR